MASPGMPVSLPSDTVKLPDRILEFSLDATLENGEGTASNPVLKRISRTGEGFHSQGRHEKQGLSIHFI